MYILLYILLFMCSVLIFLDARSRGNSIFQALLWGVGAFGVLIIVLPIWLLLRPPKIETHENVSYIGTSEWYIIWTVIGFIIGLLIAAYNEHTFINCTYYAGFFAGVSSACGWIIAKIISKLKNIKEI